MTSRHNSKYNPMNPGLQGSEVGDVGTKLANLATSATGVMIEPKPATVKSTTFIYKEGPDDMNGVAVPGGPLTKTEEQDAKVLGIPEIIRRRGAPQLIM